LSPITPATISAIEASLGAVPGSPSSAIPMMATAAVPGAGPDRVRPADGDVPQHEREQVEADAVPIVSTTGAAA